MFALHPIKTRCAWTLTRLVVAGLPLLRACPPQPPCHPCRPLTQTTTTTSSPTQGVHHSLISTSGDNLFCDSQPTCSWTASFMSVGETNKNNLTSNPPQQVCQKSLSEIEPSKPNIKVTLAFKSCHKSCFQKKLPPQTTISKQ